MYEIVTFGSATRDIVVISKNLVPVEGKVFLTGKGFCLPSGSKVEVEKMSFSVGGGGTNTAATFASQGFRTAYCGMVGNDLAGKEVIMELKRIKVGSDMVAVNSEMATNHSIVIAAKDTDRTVLVWRGASDHLQKKDIPWSKIKKAHWLYLSPFAGEMAKLTEPLINFADKNGIRVAINPGYDQLKFPKSVMKRILGKVDVLILNKEEASLLTGIPYDREADIFSEIDDMVKGVAIMTKGKDGSVVSDGAYLYSAPIIDTKIVDLTGAGDSFGSGFVSGLAACNKKKFESKDIERALQLAVANSSHCLGKVGAKEGLLKKGQSYKKVKIIRRMCDPEAKYCKIK